MDELTRAQALELLASVDVGHLGTVDDGEPYVTPISFVVIDEEVLFRTLAGRRVTALRTHPRACLEASRSHGHGAWDSVIAWGTTYQVDEPQRQADVVSALLAKYHGSYDGLLSPGSSRPFDPEPFVISLPIEKITGRSSGRGLTPGTRPGRL